MEPLKVQYWKPELAFRLDATLSYINITEPSKILEVPQRINIILLPLNYIALS